MPAHGSARADADQAAPVPATVNWAPACIGVLLVGHVFALPYPPQDLTDVFHLVWGVAYAWLALLLRRPRRWARAWLTGLPAVQFTGSRPVGDGVLLRTLVVIGQLVTLAVFILLWSPSANRHFASPRD
ncbi:hypothetical protein HUT06_05510 [Actinomadura sp. NAK00032]|uniref:hypothetical protein n=1 Tax=Actinomadura sp. NAK00032 TaxID=2742128 RepID=UPI0015927EC4|nr:hypothetical protein [Actinomadura sp. NAK00032]QKW33552.1 hypothetical protein HUT06_05510 [Actinomadura sp. NAK00032]